MQMIEIMFLKRITFKKTIEINPGFTRAYISLANLYISEYEYEEARKTYKEVIAIAEGSPDAEVAETRLKQIRDLRGSLSMTHSFNSNIAFRAKAQSTVQSSYGLGLNYTILRPKDGSLFAGLSANQSIYYDTQLEGNSYTGSLGRSPVNKTSNSEQHNLTLAVSQKLSVRDNVSGSYSFSVYKNLDTIASNYANRTNALSISYSRPIVAHLGLSLGYSISLVNYSNPDSTTLFQRFRRNVNQSYTGGLNLSFTEYINFSLNYNFSYVISRTNLDPLTFEEQQKLEDLLASPIPTVGGGGIGEAKRSSNF